MKKVDVKMTNTMKMKKPEMSLTQQQDTEEATLEIINQADHHNLTTLNGNRP